MRILRALVVSLSGILIGAAITGAVLGSAMYTIPNLGHFGDGSVWWKYAAVFGALCGVVWGLVLGLIVGASQCGRSLTGLLGMGMCFPLSSYFLFLYFLNVPRVMRTSTSTILFTTLLLMLIPFSALAGLALVKIRNLLSSKIT